MITDLDSQNITSMVISITQLSYGDDYLLPNVPSGLEFFNDTHTGFALSFVYSGEQPIEVYEELLRSFQFISTAEEPLPGKRQVLFQVFSMSDTETILASNVAETSITVKPVNDLPSEFTQTVYNGSVSENQPAGTFVGVTVLAIDQDIHSNTNITYSIKEENDNFAINSLSGVVTTKKSLDAEELTVVEEFIVVAMDSDGITSQSAMTVVAITIIDVNDHAPEFSKDTFQEFISEDAMNGTLLMVPGVANDSDTSTQNSKIMYIIQDVFHGTYESGQGAGDSATIFPFEINSVTGIISTTQHLDRESVPQYTFHVLAVDSGSPPLTSTALVRVTLTDINDNPPEFLNTPYMATYSMSELIEVGFLVLQVEANDKDEGLNAEIAYSLNGTNLFSINSTSGQIFTAKGLTAESLQQDTVVFTVMATDMGLHPMSTDSNVTITILNENPPTFANESIHLSFPENEQFEFVVSAYDEDGDIPQYSIESACLSDKFVIDSLSGKIATLSPLDRETTPTCTIVVLATDGQLSDSVLILITVDDENDNCPVFQDQPYVANISEASMIGATVFQVLATDNDVGTNSLISYGISGGNIDEVFDISQAGIITIASLDFRNLETYTLMVTAQDSGGSFCTPTTSTVTVFVTDSAPALLLNDLMLTHIEESDPVLIASDIAVVDPNSNLLQEMFVTLTHPPCLLDNGVIPECDGDLVCTQFCGEEVGISNSLLGDVSLSYGYSELGSSLNFSGEASILHYQNIISNLTYSNIVKEPVPGNRTVGMIVFDGELYSNLLEITITVQLVDDNCPEIITNKEELSFLEETVSLKIGEVANLIIADADAPIHQALSQLVITITGIVDGDYEGIAVDMVHSTSLAIEENAHLISISGNASLDEYEQVLQSLTYYNSKPEPSDGNRMISITPVQKGLSCSSTQFNLSVILIDDNLPQIVLDGQNTTQFAYKEESGSLMFAEVAGVRIVDDDDFALFPVQLATVVLQGVLDIGYESISIGSGQIPVGLSVASTDTSITISGNGTGDQYEALIRSLSYQNSKMEPYSGSRNITITVQVGQYPASLVFFITVQTINDNPAQLHFSGSSNVVYVEQSGIFSVGAIFRLRISDDDQNDLYTAVIKLLNPLDADNEMIGLGGMQSSEVAGMQFTFSINNVHCIVSV